MKTKIKLLPPLPLTIFMVACAAVIAPQTEQPLAIIATESMVMLTKAPMMTAEVETQTAIGPKNDAAITAIMKTKFAARTEMAETITSMPTETPTPTIPTDSRFCGPSDLKTSHDNSGGAGNTLLTAVIINISRTPCYMQAWPQVILTDEQGDPLDVDYSYPDMSASDAASAATEKVGLWPGWQAWFTLIWFDSRTWCGSPINGNLVMQVTLMDNLGTFKIPTDFHPGAVCDTLGSRTSVSITKLELMLPPTPTP